MAFDLDSFYKYDYSKFHIPSQNNLNHDELQSAELNLISVSVLQRMGVKCDALLRIARTSLAVEYMKGGNADGVKSADALAEKFERQLNAALDAAMGEQRSR